ncbi:hypothetical protein [Niveibacterium terrae]|uniref:hypothetical protein n=1 Tax=Niveibacterium terrae TaxID=3373598 RepID=UPI003A92856F
MKTITALVLLAGICILQTAQASRLTCTASAPCSLAEALIPGNYIEVRQLVYASPAGPVYETMQFSNFSDSLGNFGGESVAVWAAAAGLDWKLVFQPLSSAANPWRIQSSGPDASYSASLSYDLLFDGRRLNMYGQTPRSNLAGADLVVSYGDFRNTGGLSLTGRVSESVADDQTPASPGSPVDLALSCAELETSVYSGCAEKTGTDSGWFDSYYVFDDSDRLSVENSIQLDYVAFFGGGGALGVSRIVNQFSEAPIVGEPSDSAILALGLLALAWLRAGGRRGGRVGWIKS